MLIQQEISQILKKALHSAFNLDKEINLETPKAIKFGDFACSIAMQITKEVSQNPRTIAQTIIENIPENNLIEKIEIAGPGFLNITLKSSTVLKVIKQIDNQYGNSKNLQNQKIIVEFAQPNTHKAFHIGHLRNICLGESIVRILNSQGAQTFRANFQGDVGLHVAKCLWAIQKEGIDNNLKTPEEKAEYLGKIYAIGGQAYEKDEEAKLEIHIINKQIYARDPAIMPLWEKTRAWSLEYFDVIYQKLDSHFDQLFFESEMFEPGKKIVLENLKKGIFEESNGAVIYDGEKHGLHKRVFITHEGNPTYEAKDMALAQKELEAFPANQIIHIVANEQSEYFKVIFKAQNEVFPGIEKKQYHLSYGMVKLTTGKMSSRTGDIITAEWLIDEAKNKIAIILNNPELTGIEKEKVIEKVALGAIKFTMLHTTAKNDIAFDLEQAVKLQGDSGPYLQYAYTRIASILRNFTISASELNQTGFNEKDWELNKKLIYYPEIITRSAIEYSPHHLTHYLLELASLFSSWYEQNSIKNAEPDLQQARLTLLQAVKQVLQNGLYLLGIEKVERM